METLRPIQEKYNQYISDKAYLEECYRKADEIALKISSRTLGKAMKKVGLCALISKQTGSIAPCFCIFGRKIEINNSLYKVFSDLIDGVVIANFFAVFFYPCTFNFTAFFGAIFRQNPFGLLWYITVVKNQVVVVVVEIG